MTEKQTEAFEKLNRGIQESKQEVQQRTINLAQDYFGDSAEALKQQMRENRAALEGLPDEIPGGREEAFQTPFQALMDNYTRIEECIEEARKNVAALDKEQLRKQGEIEASDAARRQARELGIDLTEIEGTGADGRIVVDDVRNAAEAAGNGAAQQTQDAAGQAAGQAQQVAGQATGQAGQMAGQAQDAAGGAAQQAQDAAGQVAQGAQGAIGQAAGQAGQIAGQAGGAAEEVDATDAARREAEARGMDLSQVEGTGADGRIVISDVTEAGDQAEGGAGPAGQLKNQASDTAGQAAQGAQDAAGQAAGQAQEAAGQATGQAQQVAGQAQEAAGGAAQQAQDAAGQATEQASGALGGLTEQVGQAAGQVQDTAGGAAQQAQETAGQAAGQAQSAAGQASQVADQTGGAAQQAQAAGADEEMAASIDVSDAAKREAEARGIDLSKVEGTGADGRIVYWDVAEPADEVGGGADTAEQLENQASDPAGQAARGASDAANQAGQVADQAGGAASQIADQAKPSNGAQEGAEEPRVTRAARRKAEEMGVDLSTVEGTGSGGLITIKDVVDS